MIIAHTFRSMSKFDYNLFASDYFFNDKKVRIKYENSLNLNIETFILFTDEWKLEPITYYTLRKEKVFLKGPLGKKQQKELDTLMKKHAKDRQTMQKNHVTAIEKLTKGKE